MADDKKPTKKTAPINDVEEPGKSAASPTSKPVLVTNRPIMKDPMVVTDEAKNETSEDQANATKSIKGSSNNKVEPLSTSTESQDNQTEPNNKSEAETQSQEAAKKQLTESDNNSESKSSDSAVEESKVTNPTTDKKSSKTPGEEEEAEASRKAERDANLQKIVDNKTYFLPINAVEKRKTKRIIVLGIVLSLVLAVAWVDVALDAGLIEIGGVKPVTHFFSNW